MKKIILLASVLFLTSTIKSSYTEILNGDPVTSGHPLASSVVSLFSRYSNPGYDIDGAWLPSCTGSVLSSKLILTAAHCVQDMSPKDMAVSFSLDTVTMDQQMDPAKRVIDIESRFIIRKVKGIEIHPLYNGEGIHDLALIALADTAPETAIPVVLLPAEFLVKESNQTVFEGETKIVTLMGFGKIKEDPDTSTEVLRVTKVSGQFLKNLVVTDQTHGTGGCNGDSGGPAFLHLNGVNYQVGVTHGPHGQSQTCHEQGEWVNPGLDKDFLDEAVKKLIPEAL
ncbi:MAG: trypsin-like serine protease [Pseudobdellovibrio sp.]